MSPALCPQMPTVDFHIPAVDLQYLCFPRWIRTCPWWTHTFPRWIHGRTRSQRSDVLTILTYNSYLKCKHVRTCKTSHIINQYQVPPSPTPFYPAHALSKSALFLRWIHTCLRWPTESPPRVNREQKFQSSRWQRSSLSPVPRHYLRGQRDCCVHLARVCSAK
ncbi:hypothetical protein Y032_0070g468 [Ancylostoma ceylanicum]|uniref:Uncharacterized protein n=1 Tax=Ancylostoma ceylanicum TaxID=53326 RepID=A0A016TXL3_9BILA|nr:hypothetical protein Y032_0070g468 [Ancylostoma ceylanicum]